MTTIAYRALQFESLIEKSIEANHTFFAWFGILEIQFRNQVTQNDVSI